MNVFLHLWYVTRLTRSNDICYVVFMFYRLMSQILGCHIHSSVGMFHYHYYCCKTCSRLFVHCGLKDVSVFLVIIPSNLELYSDWTILSRMTVIVSHQTSVTLSVGVRWRSLLWLSCLMSTWSHLVCVLLCNLCYLYSLVKMDCGVLFYLV